MAIETVERVRGLVVEALEANDDYLPDDIEWNDLFLPEILDSVGLTTLIALVEDEWGMEIKDDEIDLDILETPETLARFIESRVGGGAPRFDDRTE